MKKTTTILTILFSLFLPVLALADDLPSVPMGFYGEASVEGNALPAGTTIQAYYSSTGYTSDEITTAAQGVYGAEDPDNYSAWTDTPLLVSQGTGTLYFKAVISGYNNGVACTANETVSSFSEGTTQRLDLTFSCTEDDPEITLSSISVTPATATVKNGSTQQFTATATYSDSSTANISSSVTWSSSNQSVATISSVGLATVVASSGTSTISAYYGSVTSNSATITASSANTGGGGGGAVTTDTTAPAISNISSDPKEEGADVAWKTDEGSLTWIVYGTTTEYAQEYKSTTYKTSHSVSLTGLEPETTYHYKIKAKDSSSNTSESTDKTFTTLAAEEEEEDEEPSDQTTTGGINLSKPVSEMSREEMIALILQILAILQNQQGQTSSIDGIPESFEFNTNLSAGMNSTDVKYLQIVLNSDSDTKLSDSGAGSPGNETTYFGSITTEGVKKFQQKYASEILTPYGLTAPTGYVGPSTRSKLNELIGH